MATTIKNSGGSRALVAYLYADSVDDYVFDNAILDTLGDDAVIDSGLEETTIETPRTVAINLSSGDWARSLKIGNCGGDLIVGVYFYNAPQPPEPAPEPDPDADPDDGEKWREYMSAYNAINQDEEPEPEPAPSITSLICNALQAAFPDGKIGASSFVINPDLIDFEIEIE